MDWRSATGKAATRSVRIAGALGRAAIRLLATALARVAGAYDLLFGFLCWPPKLMRVSIVILRDEDGAPVLDPAAMWPAVKYAILVFRKRLNVRLVPYGRRMVRVLDGPAPSAALDVHCHGDALGEEFGEAGDYFARHLAGWNAVPVSPTFPVTVYVVRDVGGRLGCSLGPFTDYVTIDLEGVRTPSLMAHELGHALGQLGHIDERGNLMHAASERGDGLQWWQKNVFRNSRHVTYF